MFQDMGIDEQGIRNVGLDGVIRHPYTSLFKVIVVRFLELHSMSSLISFVHCS